MTRSGTIFAALAITLLAGANRGWACSCVSRPTCGLARYGTVDFIGEILSGHLVPSDERTGGQASSYLTRPEQVLVEIRVIESFRGPQKPGDIVHIRTGQGGGDCGYHFKVGGKFLIDAIERNGTLYTGICTLTAPIEAAQTEIEALRVIAAGERVPDVMGLVFRRNLPEEDAGRVPLGGVHVGFANSKGIAATAVTDSYGVFRIPRLAAGIYKISLGLPHNLSPAYLSFDRVTEKDEIPPLTIPASDKAGPACHIEIGADSSASITGIVKAPRVGTIEGWVNADSFKPDGTWNTVLSATPEGDGSFRLAHLPPGRYQIRFTARDGFVEGIPQIIDLHDGEQTSGIVLIAK